jgi:four helix bundle protein
MKDLMENYIVYKKASNLYKQVFTDSKILFKDFRGQEIAKQLIRSSGSICANIEEGYGRGYTKDFIRFLKISRGSARETKGWYIRSENLLDSEIKEDRIQQLDEIIVILISMINNLEKRNRGNEAKR